MRFNCPHCDQKFDANEKWTGRAIDCPSCAQTFIAPQAHKEPASGSERRLRRALFIALRCDLALITTRRPRKIRGGSWKLLLLLILLAAGALATRRITLTSRRNRSASG